MHISNNLIETQLLELIKKSINSRFRSTKLPISYPIASKISSLPLRKKRFGEIVDKRTKIAKTQRS